MAVNPKIIMMVVDTLSTEKGRNIALKIVMVILGLIMMIFTVFAGIISAFVDNVATVLMVAPTCKTTGSTSRAI